ncbi:hypothetical protein DL768_004025 [Monosporascus sp. mg162]|nr:hypothetical protein DL768_004025 [Monosporascus sp. mg162]
MARPYKAIRAQYLERDHDDPARKRAVLQFAQAFGTHPPPSVDTDWHAALARRWQGKEAVDEEELHKRYQEIASEWHTHVDCIEFFDFVQLLISQGRLPRVSKVVCFGLGSPSRDGGRGRRSCAQHETALLLTTLCGHVWDQRPPVFAHDPEYELHDVRLLENLGFRVCNPYRQEGYTEVDGGTFVFSVADAASTARYEEIILLTTRPAAVMLLDARLEALPQGGSRLDVEEILAEEYSRAEGCDAIEGESYRIVDLRYEERNLTPTSLYVRKPESEWGPPRAAVGEGLLVGAVKEGPGQAAD